MKNSIQKSSTAKEEGIKGILLSWDEKSQETIEKLRSHIKNAVSQVIIEKNDAWTKLSYLINNFLRNNIIL